MTRENYCNQIQELRDNVVSMSSLVDKAIAIGRFVATSGCAAGSQVDRRGRSPINSWRWQTEEKALLVIATQAPMAGDLRVISAVIHIATELERMADHAAGNAKIVMKRPTNRC